MKNVLIAGAIACTLLVEPALAGSLTDPVVDQEVVAQAATEDSTAKVDALMLALFYILFLAAAGGAF